jgi:hypothetical protein
MTQFTIPSTEYDSKRPGEAIALPPRPFVVNDRQLVVAMVRSTLTVNSGRASRKYLSAIVWPTLQFFLDWDRAPDLRASDAFLRVIRDFSATTRTGELAQGVSYAYWKWQRGYSWIADFGPWAAGLRPRYVGKKSPDFVMLNLATNDLAVMEAKGTGSCCHKKKMGEALRQCRSAAAHPAFSRGFGCVLTLDSRNPTGRGNLHIRDPESPAEFSDKLRYYVFCRSYASWFDLVGDDDMANWCRQGLRVAMRNVNTRMKMVQRRQNSNDQLRAITAAALGFAPDRTSFEIDRVVMEALTDFQAFKQTDWRILLQRTQELPEDGQQLIRFPDGTVIIER